jgi:hypothetical protein
MNLEFEEKTYEVTVGGVSLVIGRLAQEDEDVVGVVEVFVAARSVGGLNQEIRGFGARAAEAVADLLRFERDHISS